MSAAPRTQGCSGRWVPMSHEKWGHTQLIPSHPAGSQVFFTRNKSEMLLHPTVCQNWADAGKAFWSSIFLVWYISSGQQPPFWKLLETLGVFQLLSTSGVSARGAPLLSIAHECLQYRILPSNPLGGADKARPKKMHSLFIIAVSSQQILTDGKECRIKMLSLGNKLVAFPSMT